MPRGPTSVRTRGAEADRAGTDLPAHSRTRTRTLLRRRRTGPLHPALMESAIDWRRRMMKTTPATRWRVQLIEEQALLRQLLAHAIASFGERFELVAASESGTEGRDACLRLRPDLVVLDLELARADAIELARSLVRLQPDTRLLALSDASDPVLLNRLDELGVPGFVDKDQPLEILEEAMSEVAGGRSYRTARWTAHQRQLRADPQAFPKFLTGREQDILRLVIRGWTSRAIAGRLDLSPRSVETFRFRLMRKLGVRNVAELMDLAFRTGLLPSRRP